MARIIIIGNGFDRAHGLATDYGSFVKWYLYKSIKKLNEENKWFYSDKLIQVSWHKSESRMSHISPKEHTKTQNERRDNTISSLTSDNVLDFCTTYYDKDTTFSFRCNSVFFKKIFRQVKYNWVDIEDSFFKSLTSRGANIKGLNEEFAFLREQLIEYLTEIQNNAKTAPLQAYHSLFDAIEDDIVFVNFNYTNTVELYLQACLNKTINSRAKKRQASIIYIHGSLDGKGSPIFGIGDEYHEDYKRLNDSDKYKDFLKFSKSQWYFKNAHYSSLIYQLRLAKRFGFAVDVLGHSCGRSDKTLLKYIFEFEQCKEINLYHYKGEEDYIDKTVELSRHFEDPILFRERVKPFNIHNVMPQLKESGKDNKADKE